MMLLSAVSQPSGSDLFAAKTVHRIFFYNSLTIRDLGKANSDKIRLSDGKDVRSAQVAGRKRDIENLLKVETVGLYARLV